MESEQRTWVMILSVERESASEAEGKINKGVDDEAEADSRRRA